MKIYNPIESKLDFKTTCCFFINYLKNAKGYRFYCRNHGIKIIESITAKYLENELCDFMCSRIRDVTLEEERTIAFVPILQERVLHQTYQPVEVQQSQNHLYSNQLSLIQKSLLDSIPCFII